MTKHLSVLRKFGHTSISNVLRSHSGILRASLTKPSGKSLHLLLFMIIVFVYFIFHVLVFFFPFSFTSIFKEKISDPLTTVHSAVLNPRPQVQKTKKNKCTIL